jgi:UDP-N-acetylglucosamine 2-epimerase (non-hydrolysing)
MNSPLCFVLGTRPEIIKLSSLIRLCADTKTPFFIIHTGQHYNSLLDKIFFTELSLPHPEYNLDLGKQSLIYPEKLGHMTERIEAVLRERSAAAVMGESSVRDLYENRVKKLLKGIEERTVEN